MPFFTCTQAAAALALKQDKLTNCAGAPLTGQVPTCAEMTTAVAAAPGKVTTIVETPGQKSYSYINEEDVTKVMDNGQIVSAVVGNALTVAPDGGLVVSIPAQLPDDQVLSGDNTGTVELTLTPTTVNAGTPDEQVNYLIKGDLKLAELTPSGAENLLKFGSSGFYVEMLDVFE